GVVLLVLVDVAVVDVTRDELAGAADGSDDRDAQADRQDFGRHDSSPSHDGTLSHPGRARRPAPTRKLYFVSYECQGGRQIFSLWRSAGNGAGHPGGGG